MGELAILCEKHIRSGVGYASCGPVIFVVWGNAPITHELVDEMEAMVHRVRAQHGCLALVSVVTQHAEIPPGWARRRFATIAGNYDYYVGVHEGDRAQQALFRAVITAIAALTSNRTYEIRRDLEIGVELVEDFIPAGRRSLVLNEIRTLRREIIEQCAPAAESA